MLRLIKITAISFTLLLIVVFTRYLQAQDLNSAIMLTKSEQFERADSVFQNLINISPQNGDN